MILTETIHHTHNHGASGWEIYLWVLAAISTMWLLEEAWERWRTWRTEHGSTRTEDATYDPEAGEPWTPPDAPTRIAPPREPRRRASHGRTITPESDLLMAPHPFVPESNVYGCPACKDTDLGRACDRYDCDRHVSCGTPTPDGYRNTCSKHRPDMGGDGS